MAKDNRDETLKQLDIPLTGKLVTSRDSLLLKEGDFSVLTNMRYTDTNPKSIGGMERANTTGASSYMITSSFQFTKNQPEETHNLYQNKVHSGGSGAGYTTPTSSALLDVTSPAIGSTTTSITSTTLLTDAGTTTDIAQFSSAPNNSMIYCNKDKSYIWLGTRNIVGKVVNANQSWDTVSTITSGFSYDYTERLSTDDSDDCLLVEDSDGAVYLYIMTTNIACGFYFDIGVANTTASTATAYYYDITTTPPGWHELTVASPHNFVDATDTGPSLAVDGYMTFDQPTQYTTVFNGLSGYWYKIKISATPGTTTLNRVYGKYNIQPMNNLWDGEDKTCLAFVHLDGTKYKDYTTNVSKVDYQEVGSSSYKHTFFNLDPVIADDSLYVGFMDRMTALRFVFPEGSTNSSDITSTIAYWNGASWVDVSGQYDGTYDNGGTMNKSGLISWKAPLSNLEYKLSINNSPELYFYRIKVSGSGVDSDSKLDYLAGIPVYEDLDTYQTAALWKNRVVLGNNMNRDGNELLIGASNSNCIFNGTDSVTLYIDDPLPIIKVGTLASKYSSGIVETLLVLKRNKTFIVEGTNPEDYKVVEISDKYGIIAERTFATCEYNDQQGGYKACAIWLSANGMVMYDSGTVRPIDMDIEDIFREVHNTAYTTRINPAYASMSAGWYDSLNREYHLLYYSGVDATAGYPVVYPNQEMVFDLERLKWYKIDRGNYFINYGAQFSDTNNIPIQYGFRIGYFYRLDYGAKFHDTAITSTMRLADKPFTKSLSQEAVVRYVRLVGKTVSVSTGTPVITLYHYGDGIITGDNLGSKSAVKAGYRLYHNIWQTNKKNNIHGYEFVFSDAYNEHHFEPLIMSVLYKGDRIETRGTD